MQNNQKRNELLPYNIIVIFFLAFSAAFGLNACKPKPQEVTLPFETIEQNEWPPTGKNYESIEPGMIIISRVDEINSLDGMVTDDSIKQLEALNYDQYFALTVFQGYKHSTGYDIQVKYIGRIGKTVNVYAQLVEPPPNIGSGCNEYIPVSCGQGAKDRQLGPEHHLQFIVRQEIGCIARSYDPIEFEREEGLKS